MQIRQMVSARRYVDLIVVRTYSYANLMDTKSVCGVGFEYMQIKLRYVVEELAVGPRKARCVLMIIFKYTEYVNGMYFYVIMRKRW